MTTLITRIFKREGHNDCHHKFDKESSLKYVLKHSCKDECKWKCDFDKENEVFCHLIGQDLTKDQIEILKLVGCGCWIKKKE